MSTCTICHSEYTRSKPRQSVCGVPCAILAARATQRAKANKKLRQRDRDWKKENKTISQLAGDAQKEFNAYIRVRDERLPCISCDQAAHIGQRHASHFRPSTNYSTRFNVFNVNGACAQCNSFKSGNLGPYRIALAEKYTEAKVQALENDNRIVKYDRDYLLRLKKVFRARTKHLKSLRTRIAGKTGEF